MADLRPGNWNSNLRWMVIIAALAILLLGFFILGPDGFAG